MKRRVSNPARGDIAAVIAFSRDQFGSIAAERYIRLIERALRAITVARPPLGSRDAAELGPGVRAFHLRHARRRGPPGDVSRPRHVVLYRYSAADEVTILGLLHDAMDMSVQRLPRGPA